MPQAISRHDLEQMHTQGLSQREISRRTGMSRTTLQRLLKAPYVPEVLPKGLGPVRTTLSPAEMEF